MVRKARRSSQWNREMQMVPLKPRESEDFVLSYCWCMFAFYALAKFKCFFACFSFLNE